MGNVLKSPRFWISLAIIGAVTMLALYKLISGDLAVGTMGGLLGGGVLGKEYGKSAVATLESIEPLKRATVGEDSSEEELPKEPEDSQ